MDKQTTVYLVTKNTPGWSQCSTVPYKICATLELAQRAEAEVNACNTAMVRSFLLLLNNKDLCNV